MSELVNYLCLMPSQLVRLSQDSTHIKACQGASSLSSRWYIWAVPVDCTGECEEMKHCPFR